MATMAVQHQPMILRNRRGNELVPGLAHGHGHGKFYCWAEVRQPGQCPCGECGTRCGPFDGCPCEDCVAFLRDVLAVPVNERGDKVVRVFVDNLPKVYCSKPFSKATGNKCACGNCGTVCGPDSGCSCIHCVRYLRTMAGVNVDDSGNFVLGNGAAQLVGQAKDVGGNGGEEGVRHLMGVVDNLARGQGAQHGMPVKRITFFEADEDEWSQDEPAPALRVRVRARPETPPGTPPGTPPHPSTPPAPRTPPAQDVCVICYDEPRNTRLLPCSHSAVCSTCAHRLQQGGMSKCPLCREIFTDTVQGDIHETFRSVRRNFGPSPAS